MIGRGLLANPLLMHPGLPQSTLKKFHDEYVSACISAFEQPLQKIKTLWDYFLPDSNKKIRKKILKSRTPEEYRQWVDELFALYFPNNT